MHQPSLQDLQAQIARLRRRTRGLEVVCGLAVMGLLAAAAPRAPEILRARGLVLEDADGKARLLLGVPVPEVAERQRKDPASGLVLLDAEGHDRLQLGHVGGPQMGGMVQGRISPATGLAICDAQGDERGGFGCMENGRMVLGLDAPSGEGVMLYVAPDLGTNGLMINTHVGNQTIHRINLTADASESALRLNDPAGKPRAALRVGESGAALEALDAEGQVLRDALGQGP